MLLFWLVATLIRADVAPALAAQSGCTSGFEGLSLSVASVRYGDYAVVDDAPGVDFSFSSACQVQSVVAAGFGASVPLTFAGSPNPRWTGTLPLAGKPRGTFTLVATVTDINGATASASLYLFHDTPAVVDVASPTVSAVARPVIRVTVSCTDDDPAGCTMLDVWAVHINGRTLVLRHQGGHLDADLSLAAFEGTEITLRVVAAETIGRVSIVDRPVLVESNRQLFPISPATDGPVLDDSPTHLLWLRGMFMRGIPMLRNKATGAVAQLASGPVELGTSFATSRGAVFLAGDSFARKRLFESRDGVITDMGFVDSDMRVSGDYAVWTDAFGQAGLFRRALDTATTITVVSGGQVGNWNNDVSASGDVVYWHRSGLWDYHVFRFRNGVTTQLTSTGGAHHVYPVTDGINVAYRTSPSLSTGTYQIRLITPDGSDILLSGGWPTDASHTPAPIRDSSDYALSGGWAAFTRQTGPSYSVWRRSPDGVETQVTFFGAGRASILALDGHGRLAIRSQGRTYLSEPGAALRNISMEPTRAFFRGGNLFVILGASVFRLGGGPFTDDPLIAGATPVRAIHLTELRERIDAVRSRAGLLPFAYRDPQALAGTPVRAEHLLDLRAALGAAYGAEGRTPPIYSDPSLQSGTTIRAVHISELRAAVLAIE